jgi:Protein of unknown function (DUF3147)
MTVSVNVAALRRARWFEYVVRFLFGGLITMVAGLITQHYGPAVGGIFLAFPAIFPASVTLVEKHETQRKERAGLHGVVRGRQAAALDAAGAALGSIGLVGFALIVWQALPSYVPGIVLGAATLVWLGVSGLGWKIYKAL